MRTPAVRGLDEPRGCFVAFPHSLKLHLFIMTLIIALLLLSSLTSSPTPPVETLGPTPAGHVTAAISSGTQRKWCLSVRRSSIQPLPSLPLRGKWLYVCGNLLICTNTDSNAPATAAFLADGWLGCRLMAESAGPQLGAGNIAHYTFSRGREANSHHGAACRCRCNHIILNHRSVTRCLRSLGSCQRAGWSLIKAGPKTKWHVLNLIRGDVKQTIIYPSRCEARPAETRPWMNLQPLPLLFFFFFFFSVN